MADGVRRPTYVGGLGFGFKWDMGWMHDTLALPRARSGPPPAATTDELTFRVGLRVQRELRAAAAATTRSCTARARCSARCPATTGSSSPTCACSTRCMWAQPGKKLLFMGGELLAGKRVGPRGHARVVALYDDADHRPGCGRSVARPERRCTGRSRRCTAQDCDPAGFRWIEGNDIENSVYAFIRSTPADPADSPVVVVFNFTPVARTNYRLGCRWPGGGGAAEQRRRRSTAAWGVGNSGGVDTDPGRRATASTRA